MTSKTNEENTSKIQYGKLGIQMLKRLRNSSWIPNYDDEGNRKVISEITELFRLVDNTMKAQGELKDPSIVCGVIVHHHALLRCIFFYRNTFF